MIYYIMISFWYGMYWTRLIILATGWWQESRNWGKLYIQLFQQIKPQNKMLVDVVLYFTWLTSLPTGRQQGKVRMKSWLEPRCFPHMQQQRRRGKDCKKRVDTVKTWVNQAATAPVTPPYIWQPPWSPPISPLTHQTSITSQLRQRQSCPGHREQCVNSCPSQPRAPLLAQRQ